MGSRDALATSISLGAFAALLPPLAGAVTGTAELLARARHAVVAGGAASRMVLCVDDAHLLDDASAALVHQLVAGDDLLVVVTVRRGEHARDAVQALWKDELCGFVELGELSRDDVECLLGEVLGAALDGGSVNLLWEMTRLRSTRTRSPSTIVDANASATMSRNALCARP